MLALLCALIFFFKASNGQSVKFGNSYLNRFRKENFKEQYKKQELPILLPCQGHNNKQYQCLWKKR